MADRKLSKAEADEAQRYFTTEVFEENAGNTVPLGTETRWVKGSRSPNPKGRPKAPEDLDELLTWTLKRGGRHKLLAEKMVTMALAGDRDLMKYIYDRAKGRPRQAVINMTSEEDPLVRILNGLRDDNRALEGHRYQSLPAGTRSTPEVREETR